MIHKTHIPYPHRLWPLRQSYQAGWAAHKQLEQDIGKLYYEQGRRYERGEVGAMSPDRFEERHSEVNK